MLPVIPEPAIRVLRGIRLNTTRAEAAIAKAAFLAEVTPKSVWLGKVRQHLCITSREAMTAYVVLFMGFQEAGV